MPDPRKLLIAALGLFPGCVQYESSVEARVEGREELVAQRVRPAPGTEVELYEFALRPAGDDGERLVCERVVLADVERVLTWERDVRERRAASCRAPLWLLVLPVGGAGSGPQGAFWLLPYSLRLAHDVLGDADLLEDVVETKGLACVLFAPVVALDVLTLPYHLWCMSDAERDRTTTERRKERVPDTAELAREDATPRLCDVELSNGRGARLRLADPRAAFDASPLVAPSDRDVTLGVRATVDGRPVEGELVLEGGALARLLRRRPSEDVAPR